MQSTSRRKDPGGIPNHVAIIMDGNRRWARERGLPASAGHRGGVDALAALLPMVNRWEVEAITLFGFSAANWQRDRVEVSSLLRLAENALLRFTPACLEENIRVEVIGRRDRLPRTLLRGVRRLEAATRAGGRRLRIAFDYSSREAIHEVARCTGPDCDADEFSKKLCPVGDVDLLIRTGREQRLSDFLLWECAFAELYFPDLYWPDFDARAFDEALAWYSERQRRFGA